AIPSFSYDREGLSQGSVLGDVFAEPLDERPQADLRHVRDQLVEHTALPEQRMGPVFGRALAVGRAVTPIISEVKGVNRVVYDPTSKPLGRSSGSDAALSPCELIGEQRDRPGVDRRRIPFEDG